jgi:DNA-binding CsgD family transcriptional regulator
VERPRLDEAEDAGLVTVSGDHVEFRHPLVRSAVYRSADRESRRAVHRALADVMPSHEADRLAWHLSESAVAPDEQVALTLDEVAERASARGAHAIAASALERAAELTGTRSRLAARVALGAEAAWLAGLTEKAVHLLDRALACGPEPLLRAHIHELRGAVETRCGSLENALSTLVEAAQEVRPADVDTAVRLYADAIHVSFYLGDPASAMRASRAIESMLDSCAHAGARFLGSMASGMALVLNGAGATGIERIREATYALVVLEAVADDRFRLPLRVQGALWLRDAGPHRQIVSEAIDRLRKKAALGSLPYLLMHIARDAATTDAWDDAEAAYDEAITLARETGQSTDLAMSLAGLACLHARRGRGHECVEAVAAAEELCRSNDIRLGTFWLEFALGDLAAGRNDLTGAAAHYETLESHLATVGLSDPDQSCAPELVETYVRLGRLEEAHRVGTEFAAKAEAKAQPWSLARAERALGLCETGASAEARFRAALSRHLETPDSYEKARTELAFGAWLRRRRRRVEARTFLRSALRVFEQLGAAPWAEKAAHELRATGETVRRREADAMDELTPQERQIAQLLAEGRTTRETAAALFISPKTVEYHLRHVYLKLDIRSRAALAERFGSQPRDHTHS